VTNNNYPDISPGNFFLSKAKLKWQRKRPENLRDVEHVILDSAIGMPSVNEAEGSISLQLQSVIFNALKMDYKQLNNNKMTYVYIIHSEISGLTGLVSSKQFKYDGFDVTIF
jgi:hypothetical protein